MNIHHLELFYYVARFGGISAAVRRMPYGIQQPAVSSQILRLEEDLGVKLFNRQPFKLTPDGLELLAFIRPFFDNLDAVGVRLRKRLTPQFRVAAAEVVLHEHLPTVIQRVKRHHPGLRLALRSGFQPEIEAWLAEGLVDFAVIPRRAKVPHTQSVRLLRVPLVLLVPKSARLRSAAELWTQDQVDVPLISLPASESVSHVFQKGLQRRGVAWPVAIEASSMRLITQYVANGDGYGVNLALPEFAGHPQVRMLPLDDFDPLELVAMWPGKPTPLIRTMLVEVQRYVRETWPDGAVDGVK